MSDKFKKTVVDVRSDGWQSAITGLGIAGFDKRQSYEFCAETLTGPEAAELWQGDDLAARLIETWPNEMTREGFEIVVPDDKAKDRVEDLTEKFKELGLLNAVWTALAYERAYGGAGLFMGINDGQKPDQPLNLEGIRDITEFQVFEPDELTPIKYYDNPLESKFGTPSVYLLQPQSEAGTTQLSSVNIHETRLCIFRGIRVSRRRTSRGARAGWGVSVLARARRVLRDFNITWDSITALMQEISVGWHKIDGLAQVYAQNRDDILTSRMQEHQLQASVLRKILIDSTEEYGRETINLTGVADVMDRFETRLAAAADMPRTLLMGSSPGGLNATGESDIQFFYDRVAAAQKKKLEPCLNTIVKACFALVGGEPETWSIQFNPLWQEPQNEVIATRKAQAEIDSIYIADGVLSPEDVAKSRLGPDGYSFETQIDFEARKREGFYDQIDAQKELDEMKSELALQGKPDEEE